MKLMYKIAVFRPFTSSVILFEIAIEEISHRSQCVFSIQGEVIYRPGIVEI